MQMLMDFLQDSNINPMRTNSKNLSLSRLTFHSIGMVLLILVWLQLSFLEVFMGNLLLYKILLFCLKVCLTRVNWMRAIKEESVLFACLLCLYAISNTKKWILIAIWSIWSVDSSALSQRISIHTQWFSGINQTINVSYLSKNTWVFLEISA